MRRHGRVMSDEDVRLMIKAFDDNDDGEIGLVTKLIISNIIYITIQAIWFFSNLM